MISSATKRDDCMRTIAPGHPDFLIPCCYSFHSIAAPRPHKGFDPARRAGCLEFAVLDIREAVGGFSGTGDDRTGGVPWRRPTTPRHAVSKGAASYTDRVQLFSCVASPVAAGDIFGRIAWLGKCTQTYCRQCTVDVWIVFVANMSGWAI